MRTLRIAVALLAFALPFASRADVLPLTPAVEADWTASFDNEGWSLCPPNTYVVGLFKSTCDWIYCIEKAKCAGIQGAVTGTAGRNATWGTGFDREGWVLLDDNTFMTGLYRSSCQYLYCIEFPLQAHVFLTHRPGKPAGRPVFWTDSTSQRVDFVAKNTWQMCPEGHFVTGIYRGREPYLHSILYFQCAKPSDDGQ